MSHARTVEDSLRNGGQHGEVQKRFDESIRKLEGFTGVVGEPLFWAFLDIADNVVIGDRWKIIQ